MQRITSIALVLLACSPKPADTQGEEGSTGGEGTSSGGEATSPPPTTSAGEASATDGETSTGPGETVTTATETTASTTDEPPHEPLPSVCEHLCAKFTECEIDGGSGCVTACIGDVELGSECAMLLADRWSCTLPLTCDQFIDALNEKTPECLDELLAWESACSDEACGLFGSGGDDCSISRECPGLREEFVCEGDTCTCFENMVPGTTCPKLDICADPSSNEPEVQAQACCGWHW